MCRVLKVTRTGYYCHIGHKRSNREITNEIILEEIINIFDKSKKTYGSPRISILLNRKGIFCSKNRIARMMQRHKICALRPSRKRKSYQTDTPSLISDNLVKRNFNADSPNKIWLTDITYIKTSEGFVYLVSFIDVFSRKIKGWSLGKHMTAQFVSNAFKNAAAKENIKEGLIIHSDRGCQFSSHLFLEELKKVKATPSMNAPGTPYDNAMMESFFNTLKNELKQQFPFKNFMEAERKIFQYIEIFYNRERIHSSLNYITPQEYEEKKKKK